MGPGRRGSAQGREGVGTPRGQGGWSVLRERDVGEWAAGGGGGGALIVFSALVGDPPFMFLPGCPGGWGWAGGSMQLKAGPGQGKGKQEKQQAAQERGEQAGRVQGWLLG